MVVTERALIEGARISALMAITTAAVKFTQERNSNDHAHALVVQLDYHKTNRWLIDQLAASESGLVVNRVQLSICPERLVDPESTSNQPVLQIVPDKYRLKPGDPNEFERLTTPDDAEKLSQIVTLQTGQGSWKASAEVKKDVVEKLGQVWDLAFTS